MYAEPKRLARLGYLSSSREPGRTHERTVYHLTERGREALRYLRLVHSLGRRLVAAHRDWLEEVVRELR